MSWDFYPDDYEVTASGEYVPIKWAAVEVLEEYQYSTYSDAVSNHYKREGWDSLIAQHKLKLVLTFTINDQTSVTLVMFIFELYTYQV